LEELQELMRKRREEREKQAQQDAEKREIERRQTSKELLVRISLCFVFLFVSFRFFLSLSVRVCHFALVSSWLGGQGGTPGAAGEVCSDGAQVC
jgi:hypothetical protein